MCLRISRMQWQFLKAIQYSPIKAKIVAHCVRCVAAHIRLNVYSVYCVHVMMLVKQGGISTESQ